MIGQVVPIGASAIPVCRHFPVRNHECAGYTLAAALAENRLRIAYGIEFPGSGSDMQGFCKVVSPDKNVKPAYYYLEMVQFESEINETTIGIQDNRIVVDSPMINSIGDNIWHLILF